MAAAILSLPTSSLSIIMDFLSIGESRSLTSTCSQLWRSRYEAETKRTRVRLQSNFCYHVFQLLPRQFLLVELNIEERATDEFLFAMDSWSHRLPCLQTLRMEGSTEVSNLHPLHGHPTLVYVDITYCNRISYPSAVALRDSLPSKNVTIRRLPTWFSGRIQTGFFEDGALLHVHASPSP